MNSIGSLFSGYGGLDMAVQVTLGGDLAWYSEIEPAACTVLAAHHPGVPNLGDITAADWSQVPPVDILTGGYPCQPFSHAGQRKGKADERHLWPYVAAAIGALGPRLVVLENVAGHLSLGLADVLGDLASLGYDARWLVVRAADAGAPHGRARVFIAAHPDGAGLEGHLVSGSGAPAGRRGHAVAGAAPSPAHPDGRGHGGDAGPSRQRQRARGESDAGGAGAAADAEWSRFGRHGQPAPTTYAEVQWGRYAPAIERWERLTRPAPAPTIPGTNGRPRLSPRFVEWMMGLPEGHVTGHGLRPAQCLKMLGNGVVPAQASLALSLLLGLPATGVAAVEGLLPTPSANDTTGAEPASQRADRRAGGPMLRDLPHLLPTPKAGDGERGRDLPRMRPDEKSRELSTAVAFMGDEDGAE